MPSPSIARSISGRAASNSPRSFSIQPSVRALRAAALLSAPQLAPDDEAELAEAFFDQPHMIREIAHFVGRTPARLGDQSTPYLAEMIDARNLRELDV